MGMDFDRVAWMAEYNVRAIARTEDEHGATFVAHGADDLHVTQYVPGKLLDPSSRFNVTALVFEQLGRALTQYREAARRGHRLRR